MFDISKYKTYPEFFLALKSELGLSGNQIAKMIGKKGATISKIIKSQMNPSNELLVRLAESLDLDLNQLMKLERTYRAEDVSPQDPNIVSDMDSHSENQSEDDFEDNILLNLIKNHPQTLALIELIHSHGTEDEKLERINELIEIEKNRMYSGGEIFLLKDIKPKLMEIARFWKESSYPPGYAKSQDAKDSINVNLEGYLELSNERIYMALSANEELLTLTTRYKDRHYVKDLIDLMPGVYVTESKIGKVGKMFFHESIVNMRVYNLAPMIREMRNSFSSLGIEVNKIQFENCNIATYFKVPNESEQTNVPSR